MYYSMDEQSKNKSLKLLADPNKLKEYNKSKIKRNTLKNHIEQHFKYKLSDKLYINIIESINITILVDQFLTDIINQVIEYRNPMITGYSLI